MLSFATHAVLFGPSEKKEEEEEEEEDEEENVEEEVNPKVHAMVTVFHFIMKQSYVCALIAMMVGYITSLL